MTPQAPDGGLLVGLLALHLNLISREALLQARATRTAPVDRALIEQGALAPDTQALLAALAQKYLDRHPGAPGQGLPSLPPFPTLPRPGAGSGSPGPSPDFPETLIHPQDRSRPEPGLPSSPVSPGPGLPEETLVRPSGASPPAPSPDALARSGPRFRIVRPHARGGLGQVFLAFDEELHREVALKEIQLGHAGSAQSRARFLQEAEITGRLEHPGIVPVYGLGAYPDGRPYYAMRFIQGETLQQAIEHFHHPEGPALAPGERLLALRELLGRFLDVCNALAYAHARGVVHRDIKPANIMLGAFGETLLVDWGLGKVLGQPSETDAPTQAPLRLSGMAESAPTGMGLAVGTPGYLSPEQAAGKRELGPATDVYSLGATLYSVLTGKPPIQTHDVDDSLGRTQRGDFPPPRQVSANVPPALEAICLKAMQLAPQDRYASAHELAGDLKRWLADEPVSVYREPLLVRLGRWARRHQSLVAAGTALVATVVVALTVGSLLIWREKERTAEQRQLAQANLESALDAVNSMLTEVAEKELAHEPRMEEKRRNLLVKARNCYVEFLTQQGQGPGLRKAIALAHKRLGDIDRLLGKNAEAESSYRQAIALLEDLTARPTGENRPLLLENLADSYNFLGEVLRTRSQREGADRAYRQAIEIHEQLARDHPEEPRHRRQQAQSHDNLCVLHRQAGQFPEVLASSDQALALLTPLASRPGAAAEDRKQFARAWLNRGTVLQDRKDFEAAATAYHEAIRVQQALVEASREQPDYRHELAASFTNLGILERARRHPGAALLALEQGRELLAGLVRDYPRIPRYRSDLANLVNSLGSRQFAVSREHRLLGTASLVFRTSPAGPFSGYAQLLAGQAALRRAVSDWEGAQGQFDRLVKDHPGVIEYQARRGMVLINLAQAQVQQQNLPLARILLERAKRDVTAACQADPASPFYLQLRKALQGLSTKVTR